MIGFYTDRNGTERVGNISFFLQLAVDNYLRAKCEFHEYNTYMNSLPPLDQSVPESFPDADYIFRLHDNYWQHVVQGIVNLSIFFEAFINEVGMINLGSTYYKDHLDRVPILSKWEVVLRLVCNMKLDFSLGCFHEMAKLISTRNSIVHYRTKIQDGADPWPNYGIVFEKSISSLPSLKEYLGSLDSESEILPLHDFNIELLLMFDKLSNVKLV